MSKTTYWVLCENDYPCLVFTEQERARAERDRLQEIANKNYDRDPYSYKKSYFHIKECPEG